MYVKYIEVSGGWVGWWVGMWVGGRGGEVVGYISGVERLCRSSILK